MDDAVSSQYLAQLPRLHERLCEVCSLILRRVFGVDCDESGWSEAIPHKGAWKDVESAAQDGCYICSTFVTAASNVKTRDSTRKCVTKVNVFKASDEKEEYSLYLNVIDSCSGGLWEDDVLKIITLSPKNGMCFIITKVAFLMIRKAIQGQARTDSRSRAN